MAAERLRVQLAKHVLDVSESGYYEWRLWLVIGRRGPVVPAPFLIQSRPEPFLLLFSC
jgi:hypothetical protein